VLLGPRDEIRRRAKEILDQAAGRPATSSTSVTGVAADAVENVIALVEAVKKWVNSPESPRVLVCQAR